MLSLAACQERTTEALHSEEFIRASYSNHGMKNCDIYVESVDRVRQRE